MDILWFMPKFHFQGFGHQDTMSGSIVDLAELRFLNIFKMLVPIHVQWSFFQILLHTRGRKNNWEWDRRKKIRQIQSFAKRNIYAMKIWIITGWTSATASVWSIMLLCGLYLVLDFGAVLPFIYMQAPTQMWVPHPQFSARSVWKWHSAAFRNFCMSFSESKAETVVVHMLNTVILVMHFQKRRLGEWQAFSALWETISTRGAKAEWEARVGGLVLLAVNTAISFSGIHY